VKSILTLYPIALVLAIWEIAARSGFVDPLFLPSLSEALQSMFENRALLASDAAISIFRAFSGLAIGGTIGLVVGMLMARYKAFEQFFDPLISAIFPTPKLAMFPLLMVWLGLGEASKIALVGLTAFFPVAVNTYAGMRSVDKFLIWNARSKGASSFQTLTKVMLPAALPFIFTGVRVATSFSFLLVVAAEMLGANGGLGFRILYSQRTFETSTMYAAILLVAALGFTVDRVIGGIGRHLLAWQDTAIQ
jgi:ABC-type nitrate/sulfonate/bicarbonate transport system permease component